MTFPRSSFSILFLVIASASLFGQIPNQFFVENIQEDSNPFTAPVYDVVQDELGFLWLATRAGLYRYDGHRLKSYSHIHAESCNAIAIDDQGFIWIGTFLHGVIVYDPRVDSAANLGNIFKKGIIRSPVFDIKIVGDETWIVCPDKVIVINLRKKTSREIVSVENNSSEIFWKVEIDESGNAWIGKRFGLLFIRNARDGATQILDLSNEIQNVSINSFALDGNNTMLAGSDNGIIKFNTISLAHARLELNRQPDHRYSAVNAIGPISIVHGTSDMIYGTVGGAFFHSNGIYRTSAHDPTNVYSLKSNDVHAVLRSRDGVVFIGTEMGLSKIVPEKQGYRYLKLPETGTPKSTFIKTTAIQEDHLGSLWIGTEGFGLYHVDSNMHLLSHIGLDFLEDGTSHSREVINSIAFDKSNNIWVGTDDGISMINPLNMKISQHLGSTNRLQRSSNENEPVSSGRIPAAGLKKNPVSFIKTIDDCFLIRSEGLGTFLVNQKAPETILKRYFTHLDTIANRLNGLFEDQFGHVFVCDNEGIKLFELQSREFRLVVSHENTPLFVTSIAFDEKSKTLWVLNVNQVTRFTIQGEKKGWFQLKEDLKHDALLLDDDGTLWIASSKGLVQLDTHTGRYELFTDKDGYIEPNFQNHGGRQLMNADLLFGSFNNLIAFNPKFVTKRNKSHHLVLTNFKVGNRSFTDWTGENDSDRLSIEYRKAITLDYFLNSIQVEFTDLHLAGNSGFQYAYKLEPGDGEWVVTNNLSTAVYTRLAPDHYTFTLRLIGPQGETVAQTQPLSIVIYPPPWQTWWAYTLYAALVVLLTYFIWRRWLTQERLKTFASIKSAEALHLREMDTIKSNFFANISHEFRTPLTLLLGPIERRLTAVEKTENKNELTLMHRNASRLLTLVNQLLDLSRVEAGQLKLHCQYADIRPIIQSITGQFHSMADSKSIEFKVDAQQPVELYFDSDKLEKIVTNLLSNAFKFTQEAGSITLRISKHDPDTEFRNGYAEISVQDSGLGIDPEDVPRVFDRFFQADMSATRAFEGSGIGLSLTKELVVLHHGRIQCTSVKGTGSTFTVAIPLGKDHLEEIEIDQAGSPPTPPYFQTVGGFPAEEPDQVTSDGLPRILIVEDNLDLRYYMRQNLKHLFNVQEAQDGELGISMAIQQVPDLIISDLMMPKADGLDLCHRLKNDEVTSHIPIVLLTAKEDALTKLEGYRHGADDYISKPFKMDELLVRIENLLLNRKRIQEKFQGQLVLSPASIQATSVDERFVKRAIEIVEGSIGDSSFGVEDFAEQMAMSHTKLYRKLQGVTGFTPNEFVRHLRLQRAAELMRQNTGNVAEITYMVGFNNLSYFSKVFKEKFGIAPNEYLKNPPPGPHFNKSVK